MPPKRLKLSRNRQSFIPRASDCLRILYQNAPKIYGNLRIIILHTKSPTLPLLLTVQVRLIVVRETGLEPVWCEPHAPQTCASASSATPAIALGAQHIILYTFFRKCQALFQKKSSLLENSFALPLQNRLFIGIIFWYDSVFGGWEVVSHALFLCRRACHALGSADSLAVAVRLVPQLRERFLRSPVGHPHAVGSSFLSPILRPHNPGRLGRLHADR